MVWLSVTLNVLRVTQEYMYAMFGILFVLALGLKDELLEMSLFRATTLQMARL